jgi:hypothetical protein
MTTDFFADLERQLVDAARERRRRMRHARARRAAALTAPLAAVVAVAVGLASALTGDRATERPAPAAPPAATTTTTTPARPTPGSFTIAVLNGTATPGLARGVATRLQNANMKIGNVTNAPTQDHERTVVRYAPHRVNAAIRVAAALGLRGNFTLRPATPAERTVAGKDADVIVTVGADQSPATGG